jgi:hypothetical protein
MPGGAVPVISGKAVPVINGRAVPGFGGAVPGFGGGGAAVPVIEKSPSLLSGGGGRILEYPAPFPGAITEAAIDVNDVEKEVERKTVDLPINQQEEQGSHGDNGSSDS